MAVAVAVAVDVGVSVGTGVAVGVLVGGTGVTVAVAVAVGVLVGGTGVAVAVAVGVLVGGTGVSVAVDVAVGSRGVRRGGSRFRNICRGILPQTRQWAWPALAARRTLPMPRKSELKGQRRPLTSGMRSCNSPLACHRSDNGQLK